MTALQFVKSLKTKYAYGLPNWAQFRREVYQYLTNSKELPDSGWSIPKEFQEAYLKVTKRFKHNPRKTTINNVTGNYNFFIVDIPINTFRIVSRYYKGSRKLLTIFAIELFYTLDHELDKYNLRLFVPENADRIVVEYEDKNGSVLKKEEFRK